MQKFLVRGMLGFTFAVATAFPQAKTFEVASVKPAAPIDMVKMATEIQNGNMPKIGAHVDKARAEYTYLALRDLIALAYKVKQYQITGPDWLATQRFDIVAKMPEGSSKEQAPEMLRALLEERFKLVVRRESKEHPVLGLTVAKGGPKLEESAEKPKAIDPDAPLAPGQMKVDGPDGPIRMTVGKNGSATVDMGEKGTMSYRLDPGTMTMHLDGEMITMSGLADMLTQFMAAGGGRQVVDMTDLKGNYKIALEFSMADLMAMARAQGMDIPAGAGGPGRGGSSAAAPAEAASDPSGNSTVFAAVQQMGLKLEQKKAVVEQLIIDHVEKTPIEN